MKLYTYFYNNQIIEESDTYISSVEFADGSWFYLNDPDPTVTNWWRISGGPAPVKDEDVPKQLKAHILLLGG